MTYVQFSCQRRSQHRDPGTQGDAAQGCRHAPRILLSSCETHERSTRGASWYAGGSPREAGGGCRAKTSGGHDAACGVAATGTPLLSNRLCTLALSLQRLCHGERPVQGRPVIALLAMGGAGFHRRAPTPLWRPSMPGAVMAAVLPAMAALRQQETGVAVATGRPLMPARVALHYRDGATRLALSTAVAQYNGVDSQSVRELWCCWCHAGLRSTTIDVGLMPSVMA
jgi:hypothetical protein